MLSLAFVLGAYEAGTHQGNWRNADPATQRYLSQLRDWGYTLCEVEQLALDPNADHTATLAPGDNADGGDADEEEDAAAGPAPDCEPDTAAELDSAEPGDLPDDESD